MVCGAFSFWLNARAGYARSDPEHGFMAIVSYMMASCERSNHGTEGLAEVNPFRMAKTAEHNLC